MSGHPLQLVVETPIGVLTRTIPNASPLREGVPAGTAAEAAIRDAAAVWGLPDFVYRGQRERTGSGSRERTAAIDLHDDLGLIEDVVDTFAVGPPAHNYTERALQAVLCDLANRLAWQRPGIAGQKERTRPKGRRPIRDGL